MRKTPCTICAENPFSNVYILHCSNTTVCAEQEQEQNKNKMHIAEQKLQSAPTFIGHHFSLSTVWRKCSQIFQFFRDFFSPVLRKFILSSFEEICSLQFWGNISSPVLRKFILSSFVEIYPACSSSGTNSLRPASISASWAWWGWLGWWSSSSWSWSRWSWCIFAKCIFPKSLLSISDKHLKCFFWWKVENGVLKKGKQEKCSSL